MVQTASTAPGWVPGVGPPSGTPGWSPPVADPALWVGGPGPQVPASTREEAGKKRVAPNAYPEFEENGPSPSKRRMREEDAEEVSFVVLLTIVI